MKKLILMCVSLFCLFSAVAEESGYYIGDGGAGKRILVDKSELVNGRSNKSDDYLAASVKKALINDIANYSRIDVVNSDEHGRIQSLQRESENAAYDNPIEVGKLISAESYLTITTTRNDSDAYTISVSIINIKTGRTEGGFTSPSYYQINDYLVKAHGEASVAVLKLLGVQLTAAGERLIMNVGQVTQSNSEKDTEDNLRAISVQLDRLTKDEGTISTKNLTDIEAEAQKAKIESQKARLLQQQKNEQEKLQRIQNDEKRKIEEAQEAAKRSIDQKNKILNLSQAVESKAAAIRAEKTEGLSPAQRITVIEDEKQVLLGIEQDVNADINNFVSTNEAERQKKLSEIESMPYRTGEMDADGHPTERALKKRSNDKAEVNAQYDKLAVDYRSKLRNSTAKQQLDLQTKITADVESLEKNTYTENSIKSSSVYFRAGNYDSTEGREGWMYTLSFSFAGVTAYQGNGRLNYKDITGQNIKDLNLDDDDVYEAYLDTVDQFDSFFRMNVPYIAVEVSYTVAASYEPSIYYITVTQIVFKNIEKGTVIKSVPVHEDAAQFVYNPTTVVRWQTGSRDKADSAKIAAAQSKQKKIENDTAAHQKKAEQKAAFDDRYANYNQRQGKGGRSCILAEGFFVTGAAPGGGGNFESNLALTPYLFVGLDAGMSGVKAASDAYWSLFDMSLDLKLGLNKRIFKLNAFTFGAFGITYGTYDNPNYSSYSSSSSSSSSSNKKMESDFGYYMQVGTGFDLPLISAWLFTFQYRLDFHQFQKSGHGWSDQYMFGFGFGK